MSQKPCEIKQGTRITFLNGDVDPEEGIVNGDPFVWFDGVDAVAHVPVFALASGKCLLVAGTNVFRVLPEPELHSVRV